MSDKSTVITDIKQNVHKFVKERNWNQFHTPKNLSMSIAIESGELMELFQWKEEEEIEKLLQDTQYKQRIEEELADVIIYSLSFANALDIDVSEIIKKKIEINNSKYPVDKSFGVSTKYTEFDDKKTNLH